MTVDNTPTIDEFRPVVLRVLAREQEAVAIRHLCELVADEMSLDQAVREERVSSGQLRYYNRIMWACSGMTQAGLLTRPRRGHYQITEDGRTVEREHHQIYTEKDMLQWPQWQEYQQEIAARKLDDSVPVTEPADSDDIDPIELMSRRQQAFNAKTETDLRKRLQEASPEFFEKAVIELLWAMGYGGTHGEKQHVGRSRDGGIDGIIRQDALGLTSVYIQAKRYADTNKVSDPDVRTFMGSLVSRGASLGVFITTSDFQPAAIESAKGFNKGKIILINGIELTKLMLQYGVAVHRSYEFPLFEIDDDFFDEELS